ncbi:hypothetical protein ACJJI4_12070 [Microbulbifer sp. TRSA002]|uniref:hypothetical protein n=1 Tax=Microbulbifer sp. TRSA002 TaxID=3243382 RepID=UPI004039D33E
MIRMALISFVFFILGGMAALILISVLVSFDDENNYEFPLNSVAFLNTDACPNSNPNDLVGKWEGKKELGNGRHQIWSVDRASDGTFIIHAQFVDSTGEYRVRESGLWSYSHCLYSTIINNIDGEPALYQEVYRVKKVTLDEMSYTNFRTGRSFNLERSSN